MLVGPVAVVGGLVRTDMSAGQASVRTVPIEIGGDPVTFDVGPDETVELTYDYGGVGQVDFVMLACAAPYRIMLWYASGGRGGEPYCAGGAGPPWFHGPFAPPGPTGNVIEIEQDAPEGETHSYTAQLRRVPVEAGGVLFPGGDPVTVHLPANSIDPTRAHEARAEFLTFFGVEGQFVSIRAVHQEGQACFFHAVRMPDGSTDGLCPTWTRWLPETGTYRVEMVQRSQAITVEVSLTATALTSCRDSNVVPVVLVHGLGAQVSLWDPMAEYLRAELAREFGLEGYGPEDAAQCADRFVRTVHLGGRSSSDENAAMLLDRIRGVRQALDAEHVDIIAHSKGGLDSRVAAVAEAEGAAIRNIMMIGTPNGGTVLADIGCGVSFASLVEFRYSIGRRALEAAFGPASARTTPCSG